MRMAVQEQLIMDAQGQMTIKSAKAIIQHADGSIVRYSGGDIIDATQGEDPNDRQTAPEPPPGTQPPQPVIGFSNKEGLQAAPIDTSFNVTTGEHGEGG